MPHRRPSSIFVACVAAAALSILVSPRAAQACTCAPEEVSDAFERASAVFEARVVSVSPTSTQPNASHKVELEVARAWKGVESGLVSIRTASNEAMCGYSFVVGETYLVYASKDADGDKDMRVGLCSRTQPLSRAVKDLEALGASKPPSSRGCQRCAASAPTAVDPLAVIAIVCIGLVLLRRRRD